MTTKIEKITDDVLYTVIFTAYATTDISKKPSKFKIVDVTRDQLLNKNFVITDFIEVFNLNATPDDIVVQKIVAYPQIEFTSAWYLN